MLQDIFRQIFGQIFSNQCQLTFLKVNISKLSYEIHQCLKPNSYFHSNIINNEFQSNYCTTLRCLKIYLYYGCFLEDLIEHVPNLEQLSVDFKHLYRHCKYSQSNNQNATMANISWFTKVR